MVALKLAFRNLVGAGLRTWLNVIVLSFSYIVIIWNQGLLQGWNEQACRDTIDWEIGGGQYWQAHYDPYDPLALESAHAAIPPEMMKTVQNGMLTAILIAPGSMYPQGRLTGVVLKGIDPGQRILSIPSDKLLSQDEIPALVGSRMAKSNRLKVGDLLTIRWRDSHGAFDACEIKIVYIMRTSVNTLDKGQIWLPLRSLQEMLQMPGEATILVADKGWQVADAYAGWLFKDQETLLQPIQDVIKTKSVGTSILFLLLLALALLAVFDTQVLSIFRRRKEIGTLIALGMTRGRVIRIFTIEGAMHAILATILAAIYGIPFLTWYARTGYKVPEMADDMGLTITETIFPNYSLRLVLTTIMIVLIAVTVVSFLPTRKIAKLNPTDAIRGKIS